MKRNLRRFALRTLKNVGAFRLVEAGGWRQQRLLILCYHGVALADEDQWRPTLYMSSQLLERRLQVLRDGKYAVLPLPEAIDRLYRKDLPPRSVALTFDDGGYDFYKKAYPLLKHFGFPATVYLTTYYSELQRPIFSLACSYLLWKARGRGTVDLSTFGADAVTRIGSDESRNRAAGRIVELVDQQDLTGQQKDAVAARLAQDLGIDYDELRRKRILQLMSRQEVQELAAEGVNFELHTHRHRTPLDEELFRREIRENRAHIALAAPGERKHFCYPSGAWRPEFFKWLLAEGIVSATTCDTGLATASSNPLLLPRLVDTSARTDLEFESWLNGIGHFLSRRKRGRQAYSPD
jgi:peptidoglycan/xylan/chitin deacetylase (PgdA/CDA1 family)